MYFYARSSPPPPGSSSPPPPAVLPGFGCLLLPPATASQRPAVLLTPQAQSQIRSSSSSCLRAPAHLPSSAPVQRPAAPPGASPQSAARRPPRWAALATASLRVVAVEVSTGEVVHGEFVDGASRSGLEAVLLGLAPVEVILGTLLSLATQKLTMAAGPAPNVRVERTSCVCFSEGGALAELVSLFEKSGDDASTTENVRQMVEISEEGSNLLGLEFVGVIQAILTAGKQLQKLILEDTDILSPQTKTAHSSFLRRLHHPLYLIMLSSFCLVLIKMWQIKEIC